MGTQELVETRSFRLTSLPTELLREICAIMCWHCQNKPPPTIFPTMKNIPLEPSEWTCEGRATLLSLNRTCKLLHEVAEPYLYHHLYASEGLDCSLFVRTLMTRLDLKVAVRRIEIIYGGGASIANFRAPPMFTLDTLLRRHQLQADGQAIPDEEIEQVLPEGSPEKRQAQGSMYGNLVALCLGLMPNLEYARFHIPGLADFRLLDGPNAFLQNLTRLDFSSSERTLRLDQVAPILRAAPELKVLHCHGCTSVGDQFSSALWKNAPQSDRPMKNLTELCLTRADLSVYSLANLLNAVGPKLSKVHIRTTEKYFSEIVEYEVEFNEALAALRPFAASLRELSFTLYGLCGPRHLVGLNGLRVFQNLEVLRTETAFFGLTGRDNNLSSVLPASLRELRLYGSGIVVPPLRSLLEAFRVGLYPWLRKIEIDEQDPQRDPDVPGQLERLRADFGSVGVSLEFHDPSDHEEYQAEDDDDENDYNVYDSDGNYVGGNYDDDSDYNDDGDHGLYGDDENGDGGDGNANTSDSNIGNRASNADNG